MEEIYAIEGEQLAMLCMALTNAHAVRTLRVAIEDGGVKFKVDTGMWSPPLGAAQ